MKKIIDHFKKNDPLLYPYFRKTRNIRPVKKDYPSSYFSHLCKEIICQQLSDKAGDAILARFIKLFPNMLVQPVDLLSISHEKLRSVGMSHAKARYLRNLAEAITGGDLAVFHLDVMTDGEVIEELTKVKGIGPWTAEMFLMFAMGREDIFSYGDLGLRKAIQKIYRFKKEPTKKQMEKIISPWSPYKTYASRILWASLA
ncbi:DNA-3-methyladenine glycosylase [Candidatus Microgenomates bacterium]|nr:DNA-3-methyladenine glycosylase [Candidatus Microgenomates bacterium]